MQVGEARSVRIDARDPWNFHGIILAQGGRYQFTVTDVADWRDSWIDADPETGWLGWSRYLGATVAWLRRVPDAPWYSLVGTVRGAEGAWQCFVIGKGSAEDRSTLTGPLYVFANDMTGRYGNNSGTLTLQIKRID